MLGGSYRRQPGRGMLARLIVIVMTTSMRMVLVSTIRVMRVNVLVRGFRRMEMWANPVSRWFIPAMRMAENG